MHPPVEICDLRDIETYIELVAGFGERLTANANSER
jgi:putative aminopeptidase FrvX